MTKENTKKINRNRRHARVRAKISGTEKIPRISVFKSSKHIYAQAIDDATFKTIASADDRKTKKVVGAPEDIKGKKEKHAWHVGAELAEKLEKSGIKVAVMDKGGYKYHGRVKAVAESLRKAGIKI